MLESIADPIRLRIVRCIDDRGAGSLAELAEAAGVHANTVRPHVQALEADGILLAASARLEGPAGA